MYGILAIEKMFLYTLQRNNNNNDNLISNFLNMPRFVTRIRNVITLQLIWLLGLSK